MFGKKKLCPLKQKEIVSKINMLSSHLGIDENAVQKLREYNAALEIISYLDFLNEKGIKTVDITQWNGTLSTDTNNLKLTKEI